MFCNVFVVTSIVCELFHCLYGCSGGWCETFELCEIIFFVFVAVLYKLFILWEFFYIVFAVGPVGGWCEIFIHFYMFLWWPRWVVWDWPDWLKGAKPSLDNTLSCAPPLDHHHNHCHDHNETVAGLKIQPKKRQAVMLQHCWYSICSLVWIPGEDYGVGE